jgi:hypothetical protein
MHCPPETVQFQNNGREIYVKKSDCPLVRHWATKYGAVEKVAWGPKGGGTTLLDLPEFEPGPSMAPGSELEKGDTVWAVPSSRMGAYNDGKLIQRLASTASVKDYHEFRQSLLAAGYPKSTLDEVPAPK